MHSQDLYAYSEQICTQNVIDVSTIAMLDCCRSAGGDTNGVCHWLGRKRGASAWVNPNAAGRLTVRASSPACRNTDPKVWHSLKHMASVVCCSTLGALL